MHCRAGAALLAPILHRRSASAPPAKTTVSLARAGSLCAARGPRTVRARSAAPARMGRHGFDRS